MVSIPILIFTAFAAFAVLAIVFGSIQARKRREAIQALANRLNLQYQSDGPQVDGRYSAFECFRRGHGRHTYNTLAGQMEVLSSKCPVLYGEQRYKETSGSGDDRKTHTYFFSFVVIELSLRTPHVSVRAENFLDRVAGAIGFDDIDFESKAFSDRFHVSSDDKRFAYDLIDAQMMAFLMDSNPPTVDLMGGIVLLRRGNRRWSVEDIEPTLSWLTQFVDQFPRHVVQSASTSSAPAQDLK